MNKELLQQALEMCCHNIPVYAYGDNQAACDMALRLNNIGELLAQVMAQPPVAIVGASIPATPTN